ncbi:DUF1176 domain-containing protein [Chania multitudinisentens]|nr:DUF1176 domain-containing protein [Chania multitudinisentens]
MKNPVMIVLLSTLMPMAMAQDGGVYFSHKNWEIACDNTHTCRAAGYSDEDESSGSVLLTRLAGPGTALSGEVVLTEMVADEVAPAEKLTLWINNKPAGALTAAEEGYWRLSASQIRSLIKAVKGSSKVEFKGGATAFVLSGEGAAAVMLKMDDVQGRIGTPGALVKQGNRPESSVPAAIPPPVIQAVKISKAQERPLTAPEIAALRPKLLATLEQDECDLMQPSEDRDEELMMLTPLSGNHAVISALCWRAAYNEGQAYWVIDNALAESPVLVTTSGTDYSEGVISYSHKGRGLGDCWGTASWVWDGQAFRQESKATTGMCRYIHLGGTWHLPTFVAEVKPAR